MTKNIYLHPNYTANHIHNYIVNFGLTNNYGELSFSDLILKQTVVILRHYIMYKLVYQQCIPVKINYYPF